MGEEEEQQNKEVEDDDIILAAADKIVLANHIQASSSLGQLVMGNYI